MKTKILLLFFLICLAFILESHSTRKANPYVIQKKNGQIILAYRAFEDFLNSDKSWKTYQSIFLNAYPAVRKVHDRQVKWGDVDPAKFPAEVNGFKKENFAKFMDQYDLKTINFLYDLIIEKSQRILPPTSTKKVDLCLFLPYGGGCFVIPEDTLNTIYISMYINPAEAEKIMAHEYAHVLHIERRPKEQLSLKREVVSEGMAVFLTNKIIKDIEVSNSIPFMPKSAFDWCMQNEQLIKDSIQVELNDTTERIFKRYISDGSWAKPPVGFAEKTAYFIGYRIIEACINKGMSLEEICALKSETVIEKSGYFK